MKKEILLADGFPLPVRAITESIAILGRKGSGKTYTATRLFEQMHAIGAQCVALDPVGNWYGLRLSSSGHRRGLDIPIFGGEHGDIPITPEGGKLLAETIVQRRLSCVIDLKLLRADGRKQFVIDFAEELFHLKSRERRPMHLFLEEARKFIPQRPMSKMDTKMIGAFEDIVRLGRNYGLGVSLIDQRPQSVNKEVLSQTELLIVHQLTGKHERKEIEAWVSEKATEGEESLSEVKNLQPGECFFWSPGLMRCFRKLKVGKKSTYDASATPELGEDDEDLAPRPLSDSDLTALQEGMVAMVEQAAKEDPKKLRVRLAKALKSVKALEAQLERRPEQATIVETVEVPIFTEMEYRALTDLLGDLGKGIGGQLGSIQARLCELRDIGLNKIPLESLKNVHRRSKSVVTDEIRKSSESRVKLRSVPAVGGSAEDSLTGPEQRILDAVAWLEDIGIDEPELVAVAFLAGYRPGGGGFNNPKSKLRTAGHIEYRPGKRACLTESGTALAVHSDDPPDDEQLHAKVLAKLKGPEQRILTPLLKSYPEPMATDDLAWAANYAPGSGGYNNPKGRLRTLGLIDYPSPGMICAADLLFLDGDR